jgi:hypothetical protein
MRHRVNRLFWLILVLLVGLAACRSQPATAPLTAGQTQAALLPDLDTIAQLRTRFNPRVKQFWSEDLIVGEFFRQAAFGGIAWNIFFLFGPEAAWQERPEPLLSSGFTVYARRQELEASLARLLVE